MKFFWWPNTKEHGKDYSESDIAEQSAPYIHNKGQCGVYFLLNCEQIVYVGKTTDIRNRLQQHSKDLNKIWNRYFFIGCEREEVNRLEAYYILKYRPRYNVAIPDPSSADMDLHRGDL